MENVINKFSIRSYYNIYICVSVYTKYKSYSKYDFTDSTSVQI